MRVVITGVAGLIGSNLAQWIIDNHPGVSVVGIDNLSCGYPERVPTIPWNRRTLGEGSWTFPEFKETDVVYHCAAYAAEGLSPFIRRYNYRNNLEATADVVNGCINRGVRRLVYFSSMAVYGAGQPPFDEEAPCVPIDPYGVAKLAAEQDIRIAGEQHGLDWCVIRPHNVTGVGQSLWQEYRNVLGIWMARLLQGRPLSIYGDGLQTRAFSDIEDCLEPLWKAGTSPKASKQTINLGSPVETTILEAARTLCEIAGYGDLEHLPPRHEAKHAFCTTARSEKLLGYRYLTSLKKSLEKMWVWAKEEWEAYPERRGSHNTITFETTKGLYPFWRES